MEPENFFSVLRVFNLTVNVLYVIVGFQFFFIQNLYLTLIITVYL